MTGSIAGAVKAEIESIAARLILQAAEGPPRCCEGSGIVVEEDESVTPRKRVARPCGCLFGRVRTQQLGERFADARFERLENDAAEVGTNLHSSILAARDCMAAEPVQSYFLCGEYGTWKTYLAAAQFNALLEFYGPWPRVRFIVDQDLARALRDEELGNPGRIALSVDDIRSGRILHLFIDDLGKRNITEFIRSSYFYLVNAVFLAHRERGLTITSNYSLKEIAYAADGSEVHDPGLIRRIDEICTVLRVTGGRP